MVISIGVLSSRFTCGIFRLAGGAEQIPCCSDCEGGTLIMHSEALHRDSTELAQALEGLFLVSPSGRPYAPDPYKFEGVTIVVSPHAGLLVRCSHSSLPGTHVLRIWLPSLSEDGSIYYPNPDDPHDPEWAVLITEEMDTHSSHHAWQRDTETGGIWLDGRFLIGQPIPQSPEYLQWCREN